MSTDRLQKVLAAAGVASRRASEILIAQGRVTVNGETVTEPGSRVDPEIDRITVDGEPIQSDVSKRYVMLNKPTGVVSSLADDRGRRDLRDFVSGYDERLFNVGRLDFETSGLLILTNDGDAAHVGRALRRRHRARRDAQCLLGARRAQDQPTEAALGGPDAQTPSGGCARRALRSRDSGAAGGL